MLQIRASLRHHLKLLYQNTLDSLLHFTTIWKPAEVPVELKSRIHACNGKGTVPGIGDTKTSPSSEKVWWRKKSMWA